ncbi:hypothetical protein BKA67DRAFT_561957 [Truncatella angustata]|uniref:Uncharacterized protein n=1 Tax=Truncatella angustata TaxID=152316 RepID=A0A9P8UPP0_9PEZI|nr:uncharacterized protein BKA67DRAFT_561957 [Truncatella angustata]KAH6655826.1 hypothetical protein BKA67DRAFT_561957 [Truncatella angustata]
MPCRPLTVTTVGLQRYQLNWSCRCARARLHQHQRAPSDKQTKRLCPNELEQDGSMRLNLPRKR